MPYTSIFKIIFIICFGILSYLLLMEMAPTPDAAGYKDKLQHILAFGGITFWGLLAFKRHVKTVLLGLAFFGGLMEVLQGLLTTTRQASVYDWLADFIGIVLAWVLVWLLRRWRSARGG